MVVARADDDVECTDKEADGLVMVALDELDVEVDLVVNLPSPPELIL